ncbi:MAG: hypothetical protein ACPGLV_19370 [Bacteroidia bacterium]
MKKLLFFLTVLMLSVCVYGQVELAIKAFPYLNSGGVSITSDLLIKNTGARGSMYGLANFDLASVSISIHKKTIYTLTGGLGFGEGNQNMRNVVNKQTGLNDELNIFYESYGLAMGYLQFERLKLTKAASAKHIKRNSRDYFASVYNGIMVNIIYADYWDGLAYYNQGAYLQRFTLSPVIPVNLEIGISRYYQLRTNTKWVNIGCDFKAFAVFQLPKFNRLESAKYNSSFYNSTNTYHLAMPMVRVGLKASLPSLIITLRQASKMKEK